MVKISVAVCSYNRSDILAGALQALCNQTLDGSEYEVIVIDNNSTDDTREVADEFRRRHNNVHYCFEPKQGLSHARNRGWREAKGKYVAYTDDDCRVPEKWLTVAKEIVERISPGVFGGPYFPYYRAPKPYWFKDSYGSNYQGDRARILKEGEYLSGGNIFFRRTLLETLGGFNAELGMSGQEIAYGEETAILREIRAIMPDQIIYYEPELYVHHLVHPRKMTIRWVFRQRFVAGRYAYKALQGNRPISAGRVRLFMRILSTLLTIMGDSLLGAPLRDRTRYPYIQNYLFERSFRHIEKLGMLYEQHGTVVQQREDGGEVG